MKRSISLTTLLILMSASALAQQGIRWTNQADQAVSAAQRSEAPLMVYITRSTTGSGEHLKDFEQAHRRIFADPVIVELSRRFVCLQLSGTRNRETLEKWRLGPETAMNIVFVKPDGERFGPVLSAPEVSNGEGFAEQMVRTSRTFYEEQFRNTLQPILAGSDSNPKQLQDALDRVRLNFISPADADVIKLLERSDLAVPVRRKALETLAALSTKDSMNKLLDLSVSGDKEAERFLAQGTPEGATHLFPALAQEPIERHIAAYQAIVKICKIDRPKAVGFWNNPNADLLNAEVDRVRQAAETAANRWVETYGRLR